jgi:hypothetical protein
LLHLLLQFCHVFCCKFAAIVAGHLLNPLLQISIDLPGILPRF